MSKFHEGPHIMSDTGAMHLDVAVLDHTAVVESRMEQRSQCLCNRERRPATVEWPLIHTYLDELAYGATRDVNIYTERATVWAASTMKM